jgi:hypothetical protein
LGLEHLGLLSLAEANLKGRLLDSELPINDIADALALNRTYAVCSKALDGRVKPMP